MTAGWLTLGCMDLAEHWTFPWPSADFRVLRWITLTPHAVLNGSAARGTLLFQIHKKWTYKLPKVEVVLRFHRKSSPQLSTRFEIQRPWKQAYASPCKLVNNSQNTHKFQGKINKMGTNFQNHNFKLFILSLKGKYLLPRNYSCFPFRYAQV